MRLVVDGRTYRGQAVDLSGADVPPAAVVDAIAGRPTTRVAVDCAAPGPGHETLGAVGVGRPPTLRSALAAAARSRGHVAPGAGERRDLAERIAAIDLPAVDRTEARRRVARAGEEETRLRERVAAARGRLDARREAGLETARARAAVESAIARLSEAETDRIAAEQELDRVERAAAELRIARDRRLELQDRLAAREREARAYLADAVHDRFVAALANLPGDARPGRTPSAYEGETVPALLGAVRVAALSAPVVLAVECFDSAEEAAARLDSSVVRL